MLAAINRLLAKTRLPCALCQTHQRDARHVLCNTCRSHFEQPLNAHTFDTLNGNYTFTVLSLDAYDYPMNTLIKRYKQHDITLLPIMQHLCKHLVEHALYHQPDTPEFNAHTIDAIVPVPASLHRLKQRGFDAVLEMAKPVSQQCQIPLFTGLHAFHQQQQKELTKAQRQHNLRHAFKVAPTHTVPHTPPLRLMMLDDVVTTGATLQSVHHRLSQAGHHVVGGLTLAYVPKPKHIDEPAVIWHESNRL